MGGSRPCACGLAVRPRRPFGITNPAEGAPCSGTGSTALGAAGLPSATAIVTLRWQRGIRLIQGGRDSGPRRMAAYAVALRGSPQARLAPQGGGCKNYSAACVDGCAGFFAQ